MENLIIILTFLVSGQTFAHGGDTPGPHGGKIEMPGNYHTEVVREAKGFKVYLLDIDFKNPTVKESSVDAVITGREGKKLDCQKKADHFYCAFEKAPQRGDLLINSMRENEKGGEVKYKLPLNQMKAAP